MIDPVHVELKRLTPSNAELLGLAERFPAPQEWYDEEQAEVEFLKAESADK